MSDPPPISFHRRLLKWLLFPVSVYVGVLIVMLFLENWLVFRGETAAEHWESPPDPAIEDITFSSPDGVSINAWYLERPGAAETLVLCHGNGGNICGRGEALLRFRDMLGCSALIFDYPGYGKSGGKPSEKGCYDSAEAALNWLAKVKGVSSERVIIYGESLGGGVATEMANRHACRGLVLLKTFTSLPEVGQRQYPWLPVRWLMRNRFDSLAKITTIHCPVFVCSAANDTIVPFEFGKQLFAAANEPKRFMALNDDHNDRVPDEFLTNLRRFLDEHKLPK